MFLIFVGHGSNLQVPVQITNCKDLHIAHYLFINEFFLLMTFVNNLMNYLAKMRILTLLFTLLRKCKSKPEVKLWFIRKNYFFLKSMDYVENYFKKKNYNINILYLK